MLTPTIHLNGTSAESLLKTSDHAIRKLREAISALGEAMPNARDYYHQGSEAFYQAQNEHRAREQAIAKVLEDMVAIHLHVLDQADALKAQRAGL